MGPVVHLSKIKKGYNLGKLIILAYKLFEIYKESEMLEVPEWQSKNLSQ